MELQASGAVRFSRQMTRSYASAFDALLTTHHLTMREMHVLLFLANNPQFDTARDICQRRGLLKSQVSQGVDTLCKRGILFRQDDANDRRCVHLQLTNLGATLGKQAQTAQQAWWAGLTANFTPEETQQLDQLADKLMVNAQTMEDGK